MFMGVSSASASRSRAEPGLRVSVQPFNGELGPALRDQVARLLRARGYRVVTSLPRVGGTGQYLSMARDHHVAAFVTGDLEEGPRRHCVTFLLWDGVTGSVQARWSAAAVPKRLPKAIAKGFWKHLGPAFSGVQAPPSNELPPAPTQRIDAGGRLD
jgi:hypothetical protein